jgi:hypothetical protein
MSLELFADHFDKSVIHYNTALGRWWTTSASSICWSGRTDDTRLMTVLTARTT